MPDDVGLPIFVVTYYDEQWESIEDLLIEDATYREVLAAVASWLNYQHALDQGNKDESHPLAGVAGLIIGGSHGEA